MIYPHQPIGPQRLDRIERALRVADAQRLSIARAGWLQVRTGRVWLTRDGGGDDLVLDAGEQLWLGRGESVVLEPWRQGRAALLAWSLSQPAQAPDLPPLAAARLAPGRCAGLAGAVLTGTGAWAALALALRALAGGLLAAARSAEARASRAQGAMPAAESMASSGALQ